MIPIEFLRQFRVFEYAIFDFVAAFLGMWFLAPWLSKLFLKIGIDIPRINWIYLTLPISVLAHVLVGNITPMTRDFLNIEGYYILKVVILILFFWG